MHADHGEHAEPQRDPNAEVDQAAARRQRGDPLYDEFKAFLGREARLITALVVRTVCQRMVARLLTRGDAGRRSRQIVSWSARCGKNLKEPAGLRGRNPGLEACSRKVRCRTQQRQPTRRSWAGDAPAASGAPAYFGKRRRRAGGWGRN
jgi:hypothetical protein